MQGLLSRRIDQEALRARLQLGCLVTGSSEGQVQGCRATVPCKSLVGLETTGPYPGLVLEQPALGAPLYRGGCPLNCTGENTGGPQRRWWRGSPILPASPLWGWPCPPCVRCAGDRGQGPSGAIPWPHPPAMGCAWGVSGGCSPPQGRRCGGDGWLGLCLAQPQGFSVLPPPGLSPSSPHLSNT